MWKRESFLVNSEEGIVNKSVALATESPRLGKPRHPPLTRGALVCASILPGNETRKTQGTKNLLQTSRCSRFSLCNALGYDNQAAVGLGVFAGGQADELVPVDGGLAGVEHLQGMAGLDELVELLLVGGVY